MKLGSLVYLGLFIITTSLESVINKNITFQIMLTKQLLKSQFECISYFEVNIFSKEFKKRVLLKLSKIKPGDTKIYHFFPGDHLHSFHSANNKTCFFY